MQLGGLSWGHAPSPCRLGHEEPRGALAWWHRARWAQLEGPRLGTRSREVNTEGVPNPACRSHCPPGSLQRTRDTPVAAAGATNGASPAEGALARGTRLPRGPMARSGPSKGPREAGGTGAPGQGRGFNAGPMGHFHVPQVSSAAVGRAGGLQSSCHTGCSWAGVHPGAGRTAGRCLSADRQHPSPDRPHTNTVVCLRLVVRLHCSVSTLVVWLHPGTSARVLDSGGQSAGACAVLGREPACTRASPSIHPLGTNLRIFCQSPKLVTEPSTTVSAQSRGSIGLLCPQGPRLRGAGTVPGGPRQVQSWPVVAPRAPHPETPVLWQEQ